MQTGGITRTRHGRNARRAAAWLVCLCACEPTLAQPVLSVATDAEPELALRIEVSLTPIPRPTGLDPAATGQRLGLSLLPRGPSALGLAVAVDGIAPPQRTSAAAALITYAPLRVDLGLHWRYLTPDNRQFDLTAWRRVAQLADPHAIVPPDQPVYGARFEMDLSSGRGLVAEHGFIGLQLESGARLAVRREEGRPMLYYRSRF